MESQTLRLSNHLIVLRDQEQMLIADRDYLVPLHLKSGGDKLLSFAESFKDGLPSGSIPAEARELAEVLLDIGVLKSTAESSNAFSLADISNEGETPPSLEVHLLISEDCNFSCTYCLDGDATYSKKRSSQMQFATAQVFVRWLEEQVLRTGGSATVHFFGGEPMLGWRSIAAIAKEADKRIPNVSFYITTNLSILPDEFLRQIDGLDFVFDVTVDGPEHIHNLSRPFKKGKASSFQIVTRNIRRLVSSGKVVLGKMVLGAHNDAYIEEAFEIQKELGCKRTSIAPVRGLNSDGVIVSDLADPKVVQKEITKVVRRHIRGDWLFDKVELVQDIMHSRKGLFQYCGAGADHSQVVDHQGNAFDCAWTVGRPEFQVGRVVDGNLILDSEADERFQQLVSINHQSACLKCSYRYTCGGPCPASRVLGGADYAAMFDRERQVKCAISQTVVNELLWHMAGRSLS